VNERTRDLVRFHTRHKLLLLAHSPQTYSELGRLVASVRPTVVERVAVDYAFAFALALTFIPTRGRHANVLRHMAGYLRDVITSQARRELTTAIGDYQSGLVPLAVPAQLIARHAELNEIQYLCEQVYLDLAKRVVGKSDTQTQLELTAPTA